MKKAHPPSGWAFNYRAVKQPLLYLTYLVFFQLVLYHPFFQQMEENIEVLFPDNLFDFLSLDFLEVAFYIIH